MVRYSVTVRLPIMLPTKPFYYKFQIKEGGEIIYFTPPEARAISEFPPLPPPRVSRSPPCRRGLISRLRSSKAKEGNLLLLLLICSIIRCLHNCFIEYFKFFHFALLDTTIDSNSCNSVDCMLELVLDYDR